MCSSFFKIPNHGLQKLEKDLPSALVFSLIFPVSSSFKLTCHVLLEINGLIAQTFVRLDGV
jgi:hypothetical protein